MDLRDLSLRILQEFLVFGVLGSVIFLPMIEDNGGVSLLVMIAE